MAILLIRSVFKLTALSWKKTFQIITGQPCTVLTFFFTFKDETNEKTCLKSEKKNGSGNKIGQTIMSEGNLIILSSLWGIIKHLSVGFLW